MVQTKFDSAEQARKKANDKLVQKIKDVQNVTGLDGKFLVVEDVTDSGDVYVPFGDLNIIFGVKGTNVYKLDVTKLEEQLKDPTKGELVVTLDKSAKRIQIKSRNKEQQWFETYHALLTLENVDVSNVDLALLGAIKKYIVTTFNVTGYDTRLVTYTELAQAIKDNGSTAKPSSAQTSGSSQPTKPTQGGSTSQK